MDPLSKKILFSKRDERMSQNCSFKYWKISQILFSKKMKKVSKISFQKRFLKDKKWARNVSNRNL
jgi:hypothetical protein